MAASRRRASATLRVSVPMVSKSVRMAGKPSIRGKAPTEGFQPTSPVWLAGRRIEPPPSVPIAAAAMPAATLAAAPPDEPPGVSRRSHGLRVTPNMSFFV
jgi:hypothetical protein